MGGYSYKGTWNNELEYKRGYVFKGTKTRNSNVREVVLLNNSNIREVTLIKELQLETMNSSIREATFIMKLETTN